MQRNRWVGNLRALAAGAGWSIALTAHAQQAVSPPSTSSIDPLRASSYTVISNAAHYRIWSRVSITTNDSGALTPRTNAFTQLSTGLNRWTTNGWAEARPELVATTNGVVARGATHSASFAPNINSYGAVQIGTPTHDTIKTHPLCLAYEDPSARTNVYFAIVQDSTAEIQGSNRVAYLDAFSGANANIVYTYTRAGIRQEVRFRSPPPSPEIFNLNPRTTHLVMISEFVDFPQPQIQSRSVPAGWETLPDDTIDVGGMRMIPGRAFAAPDARKSLRVAKEWRNVNGRTLLFERLQYARAQADLQRLSLDSTNSTGVVTNASVSPKRRYFARSDLPPSPTLRLSRYVPASHPKAAAAKPEFVMDWDWVQSGQSWYFSCGSTAVVDGECYLSSAGFEANSYVKFTQYSSLEIDGGLDWEGDQGCGPGSAVFTSVLDDSVGESTAWFFPDDVGEYWGIKIDDCASFSVAQDNFDVRYAGNGLVLNAVCLPTVTIAATDSLAVKGVNPEDTAAFIITRADGDWSQALQVNYAVSGAAVNGVDYQTLSGSISIPANEESATLAIHPLASGTIAFEKLITITLQSDPAYLVGSPGSASACIYDPSAPVPPAVTAPSGLVSWWRAENDANDAIGVNNGTIVNGVTYGLGEVGRAFHFDGNSSYVRIPAAPSLGFGDELTIELWYRAEGIDNEGLIARRNNESGPLNYEVAVTPGVHIDAFFNDPSVSGDTDQPGTMFELSRAAPAPSTATFHHLAVSYHQATASTVELKTYLDGQLVRTRSFTASLANAVNSGAAVTIGTEAEYGGWFRGTIDDVALYSRVLSDAEIQSIYNAGRGGKCVAPRITTQPGSQTVGGGASATLSVAVSSTACTPLNYEWFHNGALVPGATSSALQITGAHLADAGAYWVVAGNSVGSVSSATATLTVQEVARPTFSPVGGSYSSSQNVTVTCATPGATIYFTTDGSEPDPATDPTVASGGAVPVGQTLTLKAKALKVAWTASETESEGYLIGQPGQPPTVTISPPDGTTLLASDDLQLIVEASDADGSVAKIELFRDGTKIAETSQSVLVYTMSEVAAGSYTFSARAIDNAGLVGVTAPITVIVNASGPVLSIAGMQPFFNSSPGTFAASVLGVNPGTLSSLTLNGVPVPLRTGQFPLTATLDQQGANTFTLAATDNQSRSGSASTTVYLDSLPPLISITSPANNASFGVSRINVSGTFTERNLKQITVNGVPAFISGNTFTALNVPLVGNVVAISAGGYHNLALRADGTVVAWGANTSGQATVPSGLGQVASIAAGWTHSLALKNDGTVVGWGDNGSGQATPPSGLSGVAAVSAGYQHSLALKSDGTVVAWGDCSSSRCSPSGLGVTRAIADGWQHSLALDANHQVHAWGQDDYGETDVPLSLGVSMAIAAGLYGSFALQSDGTVVAWGSNPFGALNVPPGLNAVAIAAGRIAHALALKADGTVVGWGSDSHGEADPPAGLTGVIGISGGIYSSLALKSDGTVVAWGYNGLGQCDIPAALQQSTLTVTAEDLAGNLNTTSITVSRTPDTAGNLTDPVQLSATPVGGFAPLIATFTPQAGVPGTIQHVRYDWDGDGNNDYDAGTSLAPIQHTYAAGQFFPVVTIETTAGKFSSAGGWNSPDAARLRINVQVPPEQITDATISVTDPIDIKATVDGKLYILSRSTASILEYDTTATPPTQVRSVTGIGNTPTGLDVDREGNVYVALSTDNQVAKFRPNTYSFELDSNGSGTGFGHGSGFIGGAGAGDGQFNAPCDVAISPDGSEIAVSDSGNNRVQRFSLALDGDFKGSFGQQGTGIGEFSEPKGLVYDGVGYLYIVDAANNRLSVAFPPTVVGVSGSSGANLGQFQSAMNLAMGERGLYVTDTGNARVQVFDPPSYGGVTPTALASRCALSAESGLVQPTSVAVVDRPTGTQICVADSGKNEILFFKLPSDAANGPLTVWTLMTQQLLDGNIGDALPYFSASTADAYRQAYVSIGPGELATQIAQIPSLVPIFVRNDTAQYRFDQIIQGVKVTFPVDFVKENGVWKILEY